MVCRNHNIDPFGLGCHWLATSQPFLINTLIQAMHCKLCAIRIVTIKNNLKSFFLITIHRNEDLKLMLDGSKDSLKLEAMKRIIGMIAKGRDASDL